MTHSTNEKKKKNSILALKDFAKGGGLQCLEAATLGMPFEVWKTRMGRYRHETSVGALRHIVATKGVFGLWQSLPAKLVESGSKGAILLFSKEAIMRICSDHLGLNSPVSGVVAGCGGGICQTIVMSPCTYIVTAKVNSPSHLTFYQIVSKTFRSHGLMGFYSGALAVAMRQATNWASRQGFTDTIRSSLMNRYPSSDNKLTISKEILAGIAGGLLSTWNQPFEVLRIAMQSHASEGNPKVGIIQMARNIYRTEGLPVFFKGIVPRMGLSVWQTLFMVTGAKVLSDHFNI